MKHYWYSILLVLSIMVLTLADILPGGDQKKVISREQQPGTAEVSMDEKISRETIAEPVPEEILLDGIPLDSEPEEQAVRPEVPENFSEVLFIGDSRTVGLSEYGDLGEAEVFANSGMTVFNLFDEQVKLENGNKVGLEGLLTDKSYHTIYLMLGINEMGYDFTSIVKKYQSTVSRLKEMQPSATIVLEANLHVTGEKSLQSQIYNNEKINALNQEIKRIAESNGCYFIDVNEIFDDGDGNLAKDYSSDGSHVLGKYYSEWVEWIRMENKTERFERDSS